MKFKFFFISIFVTSFTNCKFKTETKLEEFNKADSSLIQNIPTNEFEIYYRQIQHHAEIYPKFASQSDSIYLARTILFGFIDSLKLKLKQKDPKGEKTNTGQAFLISNNEPYNLQSHLVAYYNTCTWGLTKEKIRMAETIFPIAKEIETNKNWKVKYFSDTPTIAILTLLTKIGNDGFKLAIFALREMTEKIID